MLPRVFIPYLQIGHGLFNFILFAAFVFQGRLGWLIRRNRQAGRPPEPVTVRRHRRLGPCLGALMPIGFLGGLMLCYLDNRVWIKYPFHLTVGALLVLAVISTWIISRKIHGPRSPWRTPHFIVGLVILLIFLWQIFLGLNLLL